ncbi:alpha/beta fold hydrolase [Parvularcula maris]|uniref:Alpha/beta hydrolase n=1 Tax=Parvularcula maris TaxID=2965077 RepID=A0A9X2LAY9_9PROT|nr:alpha/beta hydrolase [Parvularcula maris]MCQ8186144.1 alpha/beta hydrolase [Parvularcula maris]
MEARLIAAPSVTFPEGASASYFESFDGATIRLVDYGGSGERGVCLVVPGWTEPAEKYAEVALDLRDRDFAVHCIDPRGQGLSLRLCTEDQRGRIDDFAKYVGDLRHAVGLLGTDRLTLLGHSMGGLTVLSYLCSGGNAQCAVLSAPATRIFPHVWQRLGVRAAAGLLCRLGLQDRPLSKEGGEAMVFEGNSFTSDEKRHGYLKGLLETSDDLRLPRQTPAMVRALHRQQRWLDREGLGQLRVPTAIVSASEDSVVDSTHHQEIAKAHPELITLTEIEGAKHEILMERDELRDQFWDAFDQHMERYLEPASAERT